MLTTSWLQDSCCNDSALFLRRGGKNSGKHISKDMEFSQVHSASFSLARIVALGILAGIVLPNTTEVFLVRKNGKYVLCNQLAMSATNTFPGPRRGIFPKKSKGINKCLQLENGSHLNNFETKDQMKILFLVLE